MSYRLPYSENFHFSNLLAASEAGCWKFDFGVFEKSPVNIFNDYIFEISLFHWSKCTIERAICLILIIKSTQARCEVAGCNWELNPWQGALQHPWMAGAFHIYTIWFPYEFNFFQSFSRVTFSYENIFFACYSLPSSWPKSQEFLSKHVCFLF